MEGIKWRELREIGAVCSEKTFLKAVEIWLVKPHVVNRRLSGAVVVHRSHTDRVRLEQLSNFTAECQSSNSKEGDVLDESATCQRSTAEPEETTSEQNSDEVSKLKTTGDTVCGSSGERSRFELCVRKLIPRQSGKVTTEETMNEIIIIDHQETTATFALLQDVAGNRDLATADVDEECKDSSILTAYRISFHSQTSRISLHVSENYQEPSSPILAIFCPTIAWLQDSLLPKLAKWASEVSADGPVRNSQALISMERYSALYGQLKKKYGAKFVKIWPENTDPLKFVYEDVAIATYLIVLWEQERAQKGLESLQSFVDLGCGNGLLVHILNSEGYPGKGIDLRRRKIWDLYGPGTNLEECSITPSDDFLFADHDWLIGNHSDELTPWIPVMAARSSYSCRYFVLPCCFHDFDVKFMRSDQTKTQYRGYLDFVAEVGRVCGFKVEEDTMRIPSTKRICQIGSQRAYSPEQSMEIHKQITDYIESRRKIYQISKKDPTDLASTSECDPNTDDEIARAGTCREGEDGSLGVSALSEQWAPRFEPRDKIEPVRNCAKLDYDLKQRIVKEVACAILDEDGGESEDTLKRSKEKKLWRRGGSLSFAAIVQLFDSDTMKQLKSECGGLKTLLKNYNQVFRVSSDGVQIRDWSAHASEQQRNPKKRKKDTDQKTKSLKTKLCWFHDNHPDGCPLLSTECQFAHGAEELRKLTLSSK